MLRSFSIRWNIVPGAFESWEFRDDNAFDIRPFERHMTAIRGICSPTRIRAGVSEGRGFAA